MQFSLSWEAIKSKCSQAKLQRKPKVASYLTSQNEYLPTFWRLTCTLVVEKKIQFSSFTPKRWNVDKYAFRDGRSVAAFGLFGLAWLHFHFLASHESDNCIREIADDEFQIPHFSSWSDRSRSTIVETREREREFWKSIRQHIFARRLGKITKFKPKFYLSGDTEDPTQEVVIYEETYPYPAEYDQQQDYYPQHYNYQYQQRPGTNPNDRTDNRRVFFGGAALSVLVSDSGNVL